MLPQSEVKCGIHAVYIVCIFRAKMVYFTCDACGEQLKKPSVEKPLGHLARRPQALQSWPDSDKTRKLRLR